MGNWLRRARRTKVLLGCLRQPGLIRNHPKVYESKFDATYKNFGTVTNPAAVTKSIGLPFFASASWRIMVFASPS